MRRVLFFSVSIGAGHDLAAQAVAQEVERRFPEARMRIVDTFRYINPVLNKVIAGSYMESLRFNPRIWGYLYDQAEQGDKFIDLNQILSKLVSIKTEKLIKEFDPEVIVCTHAFPAGILSILKNRGKFTIPLIAVITDYTIHPFWIHENVDKYILPCEDLRYQVAEYGVPDEKIMTTGIPIRRQFAGNWDRAAVRKNTGLDDITTILVMGGGLGLGEIEDIIRTLGNCEINLQILSVTGKNDRLRKVLEMVNAKNRIKVFGFVENMAELMAASDFIVTKPGGLTTAEALSQGLPMVIVSPLPGQEARNTEFLLNSGVAVKVRKLHHLVPQLKNLIANTTRLNQIKEMASAIGKPGAAADLVNYMEKVVESN
ncbi:MAG: galactosyldiacylglycerol synthase [Firmicutes bacterium HGW-Firmicutes-14]|nr:MAG: galactosyldiacylglycerol synthase [Firmicutes bacterium HGW-Firmicutes-14]